MSQVFPASPPQAAVSKNRRVFDICVSVVTDVWRYVNVAIYQPICGDVWGYVANIPRYIPISGDT